MKGVELTLELGGRGVQTQRVNVEPGGSASATFDPVTVAEKNVRASVRLPKDALERDNVFNFVASPDEPVRVILAERPGAPRDGSLYLTPRARGRRGAAVRGHARAGPTRCPRTISRKASVVVLNDVPVAVVARRSSDQVSSKAAAGCSSSPATRRRGPAPPTVLPGVLGNAVDRSSGSPARLGALEYRPSRRSKCSARRAPATSRRPASTATARSRPAPGAQVLARYDDGGAGAAGAARPAPAAC